MALLVEAKESSMGQVLLSLLSIEGLDDQCTGRKYKAHSIILYCITVVQVVYIGYTYSVQLLLCAKKHLLLKVIFTIQTCQL